MITNFTRRFWRYSPTNPRGPMCSSPLQAPTFDTSVWIITYTFRSSVQSQILLCLQDAPKYSPLFRESLCLLPCSWSLWIHSSDSDVIPDMSWISVNQTLIDCPSSSIQHTHLLIGASASNPSFRKSQFLWIQSSNYSDVSMIWCLCILSSSGWVPILTSDSLRSTRSFGGLLFDWSYMASSKCQLNSWWGIPSLPLDNLGSPR